MCSFFESFSCCFRVVFEINGCGTITNKIANGWRVRGRVDSGWVGAWKEPRSRKIEENALFLQKKAKKICVFGKKVVPLHDFRVE